MIKKNHIETLYLIVLGTFSSFSLPPYNFFLINFVTFSLFFIFLYKKSISHKNLINFFFYGWLFGFGYFLSNLYWISISLTFDENFKFLIPITLTLIPTFLAIFYGVPCFLFILFKSNELIKSLLIFSLLFGIFEFIRGSILTGFPWNLIVFSFLNQLEILSIISVLGTYGLNLLCITFFTCPAIYLLKKNKKNFSFCIITLFIFLSFYFNGLSYKKKFNDSDQVKFNHKVRLIGSNVSLDRFYVDINNTQIIKDLIKISSPPVDQKTIFVWPESIIPDITQTELIKFQDLFVKNFNENHILILGINSEKFGSKERFNSLSVYDYKLNLLNEYNKIKLVPFGEFLPLENYLKKFGFRSITNNYESFSSGKKREIIKINNDKINLNILPLICYEIIYSGKLFKNSNFDFILNISEDGWFGKSIGPKQHFSHSIFRAIESGKYTLRSANNGIAAIINPIGIVEKKVEFGKTGYIDFIYAKNIQPTVFSKYGNKIFGLLILMYIFLIISFNRIKNE